MMNWQRRGWPLLIAAVGLALVSAERPKSADELLRTANEAFAAREFDAAETLYEQAGERSSDPGLVAFNKGLAHFGRGDFRRAENCFRAALGDAVIPAARRGRALYNLGNCLVRQAGDTDIKLLQTAIDCFALAGEEAADDATRVDARHNLEVTKLLWSKARERRPPGERDPEWDEPRDPKEPPPDPKKGPTSNDPEGSNDKDKTDQLKKLEMGKGSEAGKAPKEAPAAAPGQGNLPVIPDTDAVPNLAPEDARAVLQRAAERLHRERRKLREDAAQGDHPRANDW